jgi:hypothetical protein
VYAYAARVWQDLEEQRPADYAELMQQRHKLILKRQAACEARRGPEGACICNTLPQTPEIDRLTALIQPREDYERAEGRRRIAAYTASLHTTRDLKMKLKTQRIRKEHL